MNFQWLHTGGKFRLQDLAPYTSDANQPRRDRNPRYEHFRLIATSFTHLHEFRADPTLTWHYNLLPTTICERSHDYDGLALFQTL